MTVESSWPSGFPAVRTGRGVTVGEKLARSRVSSKRAVKLEEGEREGQGRPWHAGSASSVCRRRAASRDQACQGWSGHRHPPGSRPSPSVYN